MKNLAVYQKDITTLNVQIPNKRISKYIKEKPARGRNRLH